MCKTYLQNISDHETTLDDLGWTQKGRGQEVTCSCCNHISESINNDLLLKSNPIFRSAKEKIRHQGWKLYIKIFWGCSRSYCRSRTRDLIHQVEERSDRRSYGPFPCNFSLAYPSNAGCIIEQYIWFSYRNGKVPSLPFLKIATTFYWYFDKPNWLEPSYDYPTTRFRIPCFFVEYIITSIEVLTNKV